MGRSLNMVFPGSNSPTTSAAPQFRDQVIHGAGEADVDGDQSKGKDELLLGKVGKYGKNFNGENFNGENSWRKFMAEIL